MQQTKLFDYSTASDMKSELEHIWGTWDRLIAAMPSERWTKPYGRDWTYQDVPYHVAYFDRVMVADAIEAGAALPAAERFECVSMRQVNDWNRAEFAKRPAGQTPEQSVADMLRERDRIRRLIANLTDADMERPAFSHFFGIGFSTVGSALAGARQHAFSEGWELAHRLGHKEIRFPEAVVHRGVGAYVQFMGLMLDRQAAATVGRFTVVMDMPGYGGGAWTIRVANGSASVSEERPASADLVMTMSTDTFMTMFKKLRHPMLLMLTGKIRVNGFSNMGVFGKLFPEPRLDAPMRLGAASVAA